MNRIALIDAEVGGRRVDVHLSDGRIVGLAPRLGCPPGWTALEARGGAVLPGLHDHHVHLLALAAARRSVRFDSLEGLAAQCRHAPDGWIRAVGYHETLHGELDRWALDRVVPDRPVRVQHQTGRLWVLNGPALRALDMDDHPSGRLFGADCTLRARLPHEPLDLAAIGAELASYGVTGLTDATPVTGEQELAPLRAAVLAGDLPQRVVAMTAAGVEARSDAALEVGPVKIVIADDEVPDLTDVAGSITWAHRHGRAAAIHCVTREALVLALVAFEEAGAGAGDRIEHGSVVPAELMPRLAEMHLTVVTQPSFVRERGDRYAADVIPEDQPCLYPAARLLDAGVALAGSTDAPFGDPDPWPAIGTAVDRLTASGRVLGRADRLSGARALALFLGHPAAAGGRPRRVVLGAPADLCLLDVSLSEALAAPSSQHVVATVVAGRLAWAAGRCAT